MLRFRRREQMSDSPNVAAADINLSMAITDFMKTMVPESPVLGAIRAEAKRKKTANLTMQQIDREIAAFRLKAKRNDEV